MLHYFDNDNAAAQSLNHEDRATMEALARFDAAMDYLGDVPAGPAHLLDWEA